MAITISKDELENYLIAKIPRVGDIYILIIALYSIIIMLFLFFTILNLFIPIFSSSPNYEEIIRNGERGAIFLIAMTALVFAYAAALDTSKKKNNIVESGEYFLKSTLSFVISMIVLMGFKKFLTNPPNNTFGLPVAVFNLGDIIIFLLCFIGGFIIGIGSVYYFVVGIIRLLSSLKGKKWYARQLFRRF